MDVRTKKGKPAGGKLAAGLAVLVLCGCSGAGGGTKPVTPDDGDAGRCEMVALPAGTPELADTHSDLDDGSKPRLHPRLAAFAIARTEISHRFWRRIRDRAVGRGYAFDNEGRASGPDYPVTGISWYDALKWCNALSEQEGRRPCYYADAARREVYRRGRVDIRAAFVDMTADGYRLPSEAEWEYAARGATAPVVPAAGYRGRDTQDTIAWQAQNAGRGLVPVDRALINRLGLCGINDNAWEWIFDWYGPWPSRHAPAVPGETGPSRALRGFYHRCYGYAGGFRASLVLSDPDAALDFFGFRPVVSLAGTVVAARP